MIDFNYTIDIEFTNDYLFTDNCTLTLKFDHLKIVIFMDKNHLFINYFQDDNALEKVVFNKYPGVKENEMFNFIFQSIMSGIAKYIGLEFFNDEFDYQKLINSINQFMSILYS